MLPRAWYGALLLAWIPACGGKVEADPPPPEASGAPEAARSARGAEVAEAAPRYASARPVRPANAGGPIDGGELSLPAPDPPVPATAATAATSASAAAPSSGVTASPHAAPSAAPRR